ncbi:hypothetical protein HDU93_002681, partial [Gonapodya sp. JEL0774]
APGPQDPMNANTLPGPNAAQTGATTLTAQRQLEEDQLRAALIQSTLTHRMEDVQRTRTTGISSGSNAPLLDRATPQPTSAPITTSEPAVTPPTAEQFDLARRKMQAAMDEYLGMQAILNAAAAHQQPPPALPLFATPQMTTTPLPSSPLPYVTTNPLTSVEFRTHAFPSGSVHRPVPALQSSAGVSRSQFAPPPAPASVPVTHPWLAGTQFTSRPLMPPGWPQPPPPPNWYPAPTQNHITVTVPTPPAEIPAWNEDRQTPHTWAEILAQTFRAGNEEPLKFAARASIKLINGGPRAKRAIDKLQADVRYPAIASLEDFLYLFVEAASERTDEYVAKLRMDTYRPDHLASVESQIGEMMDRIQNWKNCKPEVANAIANREGTAYDQIKSAVSKAWSSSPNANRLANMAIQKHRSIEDMFQVIRDQQIADLNANKVTIADSVIGLNVVKAPSFLAPATRPATPTPLPSSGRTFARPFNDSYNSRNRSMLALLADPPQGQAIPSPPQPQPSTPCWNCGLEDGHWANDCKSTADIGDAKDFMRAFKFAPPKWTPGTPYQAPYHIRRMIDGELARIANRVQLYNNTQMNRRGRGAPANNGRNTDANRAKVRFQKDLLTIYADQSNTEGVNDLTEEQMEDFMQLDDDDNEFNPRE